MCDVAQRHEVRVISVIVFHEYSLILKSYYSDAVVVVFRE